MLPRYTEYPHRDHDWRCDLTIAMDRQFREYDDGSPWLKTEPIRTRIIIEGLDARIEPYLQAIQALAAKEEQTL